MASTPLVCPRVNPAASTAGLIEATLCFRYGNEGLAIIFKLFFNFFCNSNLCIPNVVGRGVKSVYCGQKRNGGKTHPGQENGTCLI